MSDLSDVETTLVNLVASAVYPNGTSQPSIANCNVRVYRGWPNPTNLDADLAAGNVNINIVASPGMERNTTRFPIDWQTESINTPTLTLTVSGNTVIVGGTNSLIPTTAMVINDNVGYAYSVQSGDTLAYIATQIASLIEGATVTGETITIGFPVNLKANLSVTGISVQEVKRQERGFRIMIYAPSDAIRNIIASAVDLYLASNYSIVMSDGFYARLKYHSTIQGDQFEKANNFKRDLIYLVDYATTNTQTDYTIADPYSNVLTVTNPSL